MSNVAHIMIVLCFVFLHVIWFFYLAFLLKKDIIYNGVNFYQLKPYRRQLYESPVYRNHSA